MVFSSATNKITGCTNQCHDNSSSWKYLEGCDYNNEDEENSLNKSVCNRDNSSFQTFITYNCSSFMCPVLSGFE